MACQSKNGILCESCHQTVDDFDDLDLAKFRFYHKYGTQFYVVDEEGWNAFHIAALNLDEESCRFLICLGMDPEVLTNDGRSVIDLYSENPGEVDGGGRDVSFLTDARAEYL
jgi:hypothetical protein